MKKWDKYSSYSVGWSWIENDEGDWEITMKTEIQIEITIIRKPIFPNWYEKERIKLNWPCRHAIRIWDDGSFTVYFNRSGKPTIFTPIINFWIIWDTNTKQSQYPI